MLLSQCSRRCDRWTIRHTRCRELRKVLTSNGRAEPGCHRFLKTRSPSGLDWGGRSSSGEAVKKRLVALSQDATLNRVGFDVRRVDSENWVIRASAPNDGRAALFKERVRLLTGTKWCWDSYENMSFKDMVNTDQVSVASGIYAELEPLFALLDAHGKFQSWLQPLTFMVVSSSSVASYRLQLLPSSRASTLGW